MTSSATRLSNLEVTEINLKPTGRILIYDRLEFIAIYPWEVEIVNVLRKLRISPGVAQSGGVITQWMVIYSRNVETE